MSTSNIDEVRQIMHVDMDAFYASVEQRDNPELRGRAVVVGGTGPRGVVAAASYEAREFGVHSAMPTTRALRLCPDLQVVAPRFDAYREISGQIRRLFLELTSLVEPLSLDEAYLDVSERQWTWEEARAAAESLKRRILTETGLTASAGISTNKFLAKLASDIHKPDGLTVILPGQIDAFMDALPIDKFFGVGKATAEKMHLQGIHTGRDLKAMTEIELAQRFGKMGRYLFKIAHGHDDREVQPSRKRKSLSVERTYARDLRTDEQLSTALADLVDLLLERVQRNARSAPTLVLKVRFDDFTTISRQRTKKHPFEHREEILRVAHELLTMVEQPLRPVRLLGLGISGFDEDAEKQLNLPF